MTGGEPLLQQDALVELLTSLKESRYRIEIETNGTIPSFVAPGCERRSVERPAEVSQLR